MLSFFLIIIIIIIFSIPAVSALFPPGFFYTHDSDYHLVRLVHFYKELSAGQFPVRMAHDLAYGLGYPIFNYFYPLLYYLGSLFHFIGLNFGDSLKLVILISTVGSALIFYKWLRCHYNTISSLTGAVFYLYTPYRFLATYVNGAFGIVLAFFFVPLILLSIDKLVVAKDKKYGPVLSLAIAGLILSHNVSALIFMPLVIVYCFLQRRHFRASDLLFFLLGFGLSAFFAFPALFEKKYVKLDYQSLVYKGHRPTLQQLIYSPWGYGFSGSNIMGSMSFQLGIAQWLVVIVSTIIFVKILLCQRHKIFSASANMLAFFILLIFFLSLFLMLPASNFVWKNVPFMPQIQYPWRLLMITMFCTSTLSALVISKTKSPILAVFLILLVMFANRNHLRTMANTRYPDNHYISDRILFYGSTDIAWENLPLWADYPDTAYPKNLISENNGIEISSLVEKKRGVVTFTAASTRSAELVLNKYYFPSWAAGIDNKPVEISPDRKGLIKLAIPEGTHQISLKNEGTLLEKTANLISLFSLIFLIILIRICI